MTTLLAKENQLNDGQKIIYSSIINSINQSVNQKVFFVDGPGGYGKTFLFNMLLAKVRSKGDVALAVVSSGIAALLLDGGRTAHSRFKIPIPCTKISTLNISKGSDLANLINRAKLIIWDKVPMAHQFTFKAVDWTFKDLIEIEALFEGKIFMMVEILDRFYL